jgi:hypothetical protein
MTTVAPPAPAPVSDAGAGDRPSATQTCVECWHPLSRNDIVCGVVVNGYGPDGPRRVVAGFVHVECAPRLDDRLFNRPGMAPLDLAIVQLG